MRASRGMGVMAPSKMPKARTTVKRDGNEPVGLYAKGGKIKKFGIGGALGIIPALIEKGDLPKGAGYLAGAVPGALYADFLSDKQEEEKQKAMAAQGMKKGGMAKGNWIKNAIKKPGALRSSLGVKKGQNIPAGKLAKAAKAPGKLGQRARLAQTLKKLGK